MALNAVVRPMRSEPDGSSFSEQRAIQQSNARTCSPSNCAEHHARKHRGRQRADVTVAHCVDRITMIREYTTISWHRSDRRRRDDRAVGRVRGTEFVLTREVLLHSGKNDGYCLDPHLHVWSNRRFEAAVCTYVIRQPA